MFHNGFEAHCTKDICYCKFSHHICKRSIGVLYFDVFIRRYLLKRLVKLDSYAKMNDWPQSTNIQSSTCKLCLIKLIVFQGSAITKLLAKLTSYWTDQIGPPAVVGLVLWNRACQLLPLSRFLLWIGSPVLS